MAISTNIILTKKSNVNLDNQYWFVIRTNSRCEKKVNEQLVRLNYKTYLPLQSKIRIWSDRKKKICVPLIPSIIFIQDIDVVKEPLYMLRGFHSILKSNGKIGKVTQAEIDILKKIVDEKLDVQSVDLDKFSVGDNVEILRGPLGGLFGKAVVEKNKFRVLIEIPSIGIGYVVDISKNNIRKI